MSAGRDEGSPAQRAADAWKREHRSCPTCNGTGWTDSRYAASLVTADEVIADLDAYIRRANKADEAFSAMWPKLPPREEP